MDDEATVREALRAFHYHARIHRRGGMEHAHELAVHAVAAFERIVEAEHVDQLEFLDGRLPCPPLEVQTVHLTFKHGGPGQPRGRFDE